MAACWAGLFGWGWGYKWTLEKGSGEKDMGVDVVKRTFLVNRDLSYTLLPSNPPSPA